MNFMKALLVLVILLIGCGVLVGGCALSGFNNARTLQETVESQWAEVENQLQRRFDLVDNLVETVKGVAGQEEKIYLGVAEARKAYFQNDSMADRARAEGMFSSALSRLLVLRETYPELKSNESFLKLQDSIEGTENRLGVARRNYNKSVRDLNASIRRFPGSVYAGWAGVDEAEYFEVSEEAKERPDVDFSGSDGKG